MAAQTQKKGYPTPKWISKPHGVESTGVRLTAKHTGFSISQH